MNRREALKQIALMTGGALSLSTIAGVMSGCTAQTGEFTPQTLTANQDELVTVLSERIIPATDTPGAKAAKVNRFIDHMLTDWNTEEERKHFLEGLRYVDELSNNSHGGSFIDLSKEQQVAVMETLDKEAQDASDDGPRPFFSMMKEFTVVGYYTSEIGAAQELRSDLIPGYYDGCMPYSEVGRAWS